MLLMRGVVNADPALLARIVKGAAIVLALVGTLLLIWRGAVGLLVLLLGGLIFLALRRWGEPRTSFATGTAAGAASGLRTAMLDMTLEHETGRLDGTVREGRFRGSRLSMLSLPQLLELLAECRQQDADSMPVLEAFLDRNFGAQWREQEAGAQGPSSTSRAKMSHAEALEVLGLGEGASPEEIRQAHRRLMQRLHPDHGGSSYLAARINQARDVLLGE
jgi:hypothetical protein